MIQLIFILFLETKANYQGCGDYLLRGRFFFNSSTKHLEFIAHENSQSKSNFVIGKIEDLRRVRNYINDRIEMLAKITKPMNGMNGEIENIKSIKILPPDPLNEFKYNSYTLKSKFKCL